MESPAYAIAASANTIQMSLPRKDLPEVSRPKYDDERKKEELRQNITVSTLQISHHGLSNAPRHYCTSQMFGPSELPEAFPGRSQEAKGLHGNFFESRSVVRRDDPLKGQRDHLRKEREKAALENACVVGLGNYECIAKISPNKLEKTFEKLSSFMKDKNIQVESWDNFDIRVAKGKIDDLIKLSIKEGNLKKAREILKSVEKLFPMDEHYKKLFEIIAPPQLISVKTSTTKGINETISFLKKKGNEFNNKWIAVSHGQLLGFSDSFSDLFERHKGTDIVITRIV